VKTAKENQQGQYSRADETARGNRWWGEYATKNAHKTLWSTLSFYPEHLRQTKADN
jgi:hypothetical protein